MCWNLRFSHRVVISWRILVSFRRFFEDYIEGLNTRVPNTKCECTLRRLGICLFCFVGWDHIVTLPNIGPSPCSTFGNVEKPLVRLPNGHICHFTMFGPTKQKLLNLSYICLHGNYFKLLKNENFTIGFHRNSEMCHTCVNIIFALPIYSLIPNTICTRQMMKYLSFTFTLKIR